MSLLKFSAAGPTYATPIEGARGGPEWQGLRGYVQEHVPAIVKGQSDMHAYICGLDKMVKANRDLLKSLGWDRKSILYEKYD